MLQSMRDRMQGLIAGTIAVIIALTFALWGIQNYIHGGANKAAAKVNGQEITQEQLHIAYEQIKRSEMLKFGQGFPFDQKDQLQIKRKILQRLIDDQIIFQAENKMGLRVSEKQLLGIISSMPFFQVDGHFSPSRFQQLIQGLFSSEQIFLDSLKRDILRMQLEKGVIDSGFVLPSEIATVKKIFSQRRDFGYFIVSPEPFKKKIKITANDIQKYYDTHQNRFLLPEKISIQYVELTSEGALPATAMPTEEQLKEFYHNHIDSFSTPKKWQVTKVLLPLPPNADAKASSDARKKMDEIAVKFKADSKNVAPGMQVTTSWLTRREITSDFIVHLDKLNSGEISVPFRTKDGYNLLKVSAIQPAEVMPYETVKAKVKQSYERAQLTQAFSNASDRLADLVYTNSDSLEPAARELGLKIQETELFANDNNGDKKGILANNKIVKVAFSEAVLKQHYNSNLIEIGNGKVVVLRIKNHVPERVQPLEQVRATIMQNLEKQEVVQAAANFANELLKALEAGKSEAQLAEQYGLVWHITTGANYGQEGENGKLVDAAFGLAKPKVKGVSAKVVDLNGSSYAVLRLNKVYDEAQYKSNPKSDAILKSLAEKLGEFDYQLLLKNLKRKAKIEIIDQVEDR